MTLLQRYANKLINDDTSDYKPCQYQPKYNKENFSTLSHGPTNTLFSTRLLNNSDKDNDTTTAAAADGIDI